MRGRRGDERVRPREDPAPEQAGDERRDGEGETDVRMRRREDVPRR